MYIYVGFNVITSAEHMLSHIVFIYIQLVIVHDWITHSVYVHSISISINSTNSNKTRSLQGLVLFVLSICAYMCYIYDIRWSGMYNLYIYTYIVYNIY